MGKNKPETVRRYEERRMAAWRNYFEMRYGVNPSCEMCGKKLCFVFGKSNMVNFDHRERHPEIIVPAKWYRRRLVNTENIALWESCNFGVLCRQCNSHIPTDNREEYVRKLAKYIGMNL